MALQAQPDVQLPTLLEMEQHIQKVLATKDVPLKFNRCFIPIDIDEENERALLLLFYDALPSVAGPNVRKLHLDLRQIEYFDRKENVLALLSQCNNISQIEFWGGTLVQLVTLRDFNDLDRSLHQFILPLLGTLLEVLTNSQSSERLEKVIFSKINENELHWDGNKKIMTTALRSFRSLKTIYLDNLTYDFINDVIFPGLSDRESLQEIYFAQRNHVFDGQGWDRIPWEIDGEGPSLSDIPEENLFISFRKFVTTLRNLRLLAVTCNGPGIVNLQKSGLSKHVDSLEVCCYPDFFFYFLVKTSGLSEHVKSLTVGSYDRVDMNIQLLNESSVDAIMQMSHLKHLKFLHCLPESFGRLRQHESLGLLFLGIPCSTQNISIILQEVPSTRNLKLFQLRMVYKDLMDDSEWSHLLDMIRGIHVFKKLNVTIKKRDWHSSDVDKFAEAMNMNPTLTEVTVHFHHQGGFHHQARYGAKDPFQCVSDLYTQRNKLRKVVVRKERFPNGALWPHLLTSPKSNESLIYLAMDFLKDLPVFSGTK